MSDYAFLLKRRRRKRNWKKVNYLKRKAVRERKKRQRFANRLKKIRRRKLHFHINEKRKGLLKPKKPNKFQTITVPSNFSLVNNSEEVLEFFARAKKLLSNRIQLKFDLSEVTQMTPDSIALLVGSITDDRFSRGLSVAGNAPRKKALKRLLIESGFYDHVVSSDPKPRRHNSALFHQKNKFKVENDVAKSVCEMAVKHTFGSNEKFTPIFAIIIECMANTLNHANLDKPRKYRWWLFLYTNPDTKVSSFCFFDLGVGIFESLPVQNYIRRFMTKLSFQSNLDLLDDLFAGKISSRTKKKERGKGIPEIYEHSKHPLIRNFVLIANDVYCNLETGENIKNEHPLMGTFLYWELHPNN